MKYFTIFAMLAVGFFFAASAVVAAGGDGGSRPKPNRPPKGDREKPDRDKVKQRENAPDREQKREKEVDNREARQAKRIEHGIAKGYLTPDEVTKLESQQKAIADLEASFKSDGKVTKDEFKQLNQALNEASRSIWAEKHDTDGNQMPTYRFGKNVFARPELTAALANENLSREQAKQIMADFHKLMALKHALATKDLTADERARLQNEYNELLNKYFEVRQPTTAQAD
ncbi:MAG: hypothetical protein HZA50_14300 [Planctomycetes bacterium]|nr:hypothetical protein [Planctomycetota bacterium]